jgi:hypothetical protein
MCEVLARRLEAFLGWELNGKLWDGRVPNFAVNNAFLSKTHAIDKARAGNTPCRHLSSEVLNGFL